MGLGITKPDGTTTILPAGQPFSLKDSAGNEWVKLGVMDAVGAGESGTTEQRSFLEIKSPPNQAVQDQLLSEGIPLSEIIAKGSRTQRLELGLRLPGGIGDTPEQGAGSGLQDNDADGYVGAIGSLTDKKILYSKTGVCPSFNPHFKTCEPQGNFVKTTQECDTTKIVSYNISYDEQKQCSDTLYDLEKVTPQPDKEEPQVTFCRNKTVTTNTPKFDACVPDIPATYKEVKCFDLTKTKEDKGYNLVKEEVCHNYQVSGGTPGINGNCVVNDFWVSPLALDLDGNGVTTSDTNWNFNLDGTGVKTWKGSLDKGDGFLVFDENNDGVANTGRELFGNYLAAGDGDHADGLEALRAYADQYLPGASADGVLNEAEIAQLENNFNFRVQITDADGNPQLVTPSSLNITKFNLNPNPSLESYTDKNGVYHNPRTFFTMNGVENTNLDDLWFQQVDSNSAATTTTDSTTTTATDSSTAVDDAETAVADKPQRPPNPQAWERNPWLYNNAAYGAPPPMPQAPNFGMDPLMMQMMSALSGMMPNSSYAYQQQLQVQQQAQAQQMQAQFYQAVVGDLYAGVDGFADATVQ